MCKRRSYCFPDFRGKCHVICNMLRYLRETVRISLSRQTRPTTNHSRRSCSTAMSYSEYGRGGGGRGGGARGRGTGGGRGGRGRGRGGGPPAGLSGKQIGLYYAKQGKERKIARERNERAVVSIDRRSESQITQILHDIGGTTESMEESDGGVGGASVQPVVLTPPTFATPTCTDEHLLEEQRNRESRPAYREMMVFRESLPSWSMREDIVKAVNDNQVIVVSGQTGCGKTTQISQFLLDDAIARGCGSKCHVICTQPRRISAITVAQRVASERAESLGTSVGYQIRLEHTLPRETGSILYCTTGVMVKRLTSDPLLHNCSHLILDEVHERNNITDFLSIIVKDILPKRPDLKVVLMSATINADLFSNYFNDAPIISIPGRVFPVKEYYLENVLEMTKYHPPQQGDARPRPFWTRHGRGKQDWAEEETKKVEMEEYFSKLESDRLYSSRVVSALRQMDLDKIDIPLIVSLLKYISLNMGDGAVLVFLPGWDTITKLHDMLKSDVMFRNSSKYTIIPLHSLMPTASQKQVFERPPPGVRKIVIATNIAETSITIDDVVYVIDSGKVKETTYDVANQLACLEAVWESKAAATQRKGRAGRVQPGHCFYLFTSYQYSKLNEFQLPEMLRTPLEELVLQIKILRLGMAEPFLSKALEVPKKKSVQDAVQLLKNLHALDSSEELTPLGYHLANLPVHPRIGRMILFGAMLSCLDPVLTIAAALGFKEPFVIPLHKQEEADRVRKRLADGSESDHIALLNAFNGWEQSRRRGNTQQYCWDHFLSSNTLELLSNMKRQFSGLLHDIGFVSDSNPKTPSANYNSGNVKLIKAVLCAGLYPNVAKITPGKRAAKLFTQQDGKVKFHPKSVNYEVPDFKSRFLIYHTKVKSTAIFIHDASVIPPFPLLFFGGEIAAGRDADQETITVDDWIIFQSPSRIADLVKEMRHQLDAVLKQKIEQPHMTLYSPGPTSSTTPASRLIQAIIDLITREDYSDQQERLSQGRHLYSRK